MYLHNGKEPIPVHGKATWRLRVVITRTSGTYDPVRTILGDSGFSSLRYKYNHFWL